MSDIKPGDLQTYYSLINQADVSLEDVERAVEEWAENPPEEKYDRILEAELVES